MKRIGLITLSIVTIITFTLLFSTLLLAAPSGSCGESITYTITDGSLVLEGSGSITDYTPSTLPWLEEAGTITSITIPEGITYIGVDAFLNLNVTKVMIPESVILISSHAIGYTYADEVYTPIEDFTIVSNPGSAAETYAVENGFLFEAIEEPLPSGVCGTDAAWELSKDGILTITGNGPMVNYENSAATPWYEYITEKNGFYVTSVVVAEGITTIGNHAFADCRKLTSVSLPNSLTAIGTGAFSACSALPTVSIPGSVLTIEKQAFYSCTSLSEVVMAPGVGNIDAEAFALSAVTSLTLPESLHAVGEKAFYGCSSLSTVTMPGVTKVGNKAFEGCSSLGTVTAPNLVTIGQSAFESCTALNAMTFPATLTSIGSRAFYSCTALSFTSIPDSVTRIGEYAFYATGLVSVTIGKGITEIAEAVFENCSSLSSVTLSESVTTFCDRAFTGCSSLTSILLPKQIRYIADKSLGYFYSEEYGSFGKFTNFTLEIMGYVPSVAKLYAEANGFTFTSLGVIDIDGGNVTNTASWSINTETGVLIINGSGTIPDYAVFGDTPWYLYADYIMTVVIGNGITGVGACSFEDCVSVTAITLSGTVTTIGDYAFAGTSIENLILPESVTAIGDNAFEGCALLKSVSLPETLDTIGQAAFRAPNALTSLYVPESVSYIGSNAIGVTEGNAPIYNFIIKGVAGSIAEDYAEHNGITFRENGYVEIIDTNNGASVSIIGEDAKNLALTLQKVSDSLSPAVLLANNEYALLYNILLMNGDEEAILEGSATIRFPIPEGVNSLAAKIFAYDENGVFTEIDATVDDHFFVFRYHTLGNFVITNADLTSLITITVYHRYSDGTEASPTELIRASLGAHYSVKPVSLDGFKADNNTLSGKVEGSFTLTFTYHKVAVQTTADQDTTEPPETVTPPQPQRNKNRTWLIVIEIILILALLAAVAALILLNIKKKKEENERDAITAAATVKKTVLADKFADTIVVPEAPTQEIDIQSLFADEPEEDIAAIEEILNQASSKEPNKK